MMSNHFLDLGLVLEGSILPRVRRCEELIEIELVELPLAGDGQELVGGIWYVMSRICGSAP
jgi:hypothetical protein